jgi:hypothetical protein
MGFLAGSIGFERFRVEGATFKKFGSKQIEILDKFAIGKVENTSPEAATIGFLAGNHLFDQDFALAKNIVNDSLHCGLRIDTNKIPSALRKAWLAIELAPLLEENPNGRVTKAQRLEAKEAVEARCEEEARSGKFKRMQQFAVLWDHREEVLYLGSSSPVAIELGSDLFQRAFGITLQRIGAGKLAEQWADAAKQRAKLEGCEPVVFHADEPGAHPAWLNGASTSFDFLGNEFLLWLWWTLEAQSDTLALADGSEIVAMMNRTLALECPRADSGKETITAEAPVRLPEAHHAIKTGKMPRKSGLMLVRQGIQYEFVLQAESFAVSGGKIKLPEGEEEDEASSPRDARIDALRSLAESIDLLFGTFCERRLSKAWDGDLKQMRRWLGKESTKAKKPAA